MVSCRRNFPLSLTRLLITACFIEAITSAPVDGVLDGDSKAEEKSMDENTDDNTRFEIPFISPNSDVKASVITGMIVLVPLSDLAGIASMMGSLGGLPGGGGSPAGALTSLAGPVSNIIPASKSAALT